MRGSFITLEGIDGCGKTTQARLLVAHLREEGWCVRPTREPGGTAAKKTIRRVVLSPTHDLTPEAELFLYLADRAAHVAEVVRPALSQGCVVVCERYTDSTLAYQGYGRGLDLDLLRRLNALATQETMPDLTVVLEVPPEHGRLDAARLDRLESEGPVFAARVAEGFRALAREDPGRVKVVDGNADVEAVQAQVFALVERLLGGK